LASTFYKHGGTYAFISVICPGTFKVECLVCSFENIISSVSKHFIFEGSITLPLTSILMGELTFQSQILFKGQKKTSCLIIIYNLYATV
jgi:hypothetical protein